MSDSEDIMVQALYVDDNIPVNLNSSLPPVSGVEYIRRVQHEAKQCPLVVVADIDTKKFSKKQTVVVSDGPGCMPAPAGYAASLEWQLKQVADFADVRMALARYNAKQPNAVRTEGRSVLPSIDDVVGWCRLCLGSEIQKKLGTKNDVYISKDVPTGTCSGNLPTLKFLLPLQQAVVEQLLEYHISWFEATGFTPDQGRWFYALLASLEKPLTPEACSSLRSLARLCCNLRASLDNTENASLPHLNLLICLVSRYFDQADFADFRNHDKR